MKSVVAALHFLTRIRTHGVPLRESDMGLSLLWYPLVGALVGLLCGGVYYVGLLNVWPQSVSLVLVLALLVGVKDGFHLDGLSDLVDGLYGGDTTDEIYTIMKDPALGPFGALAILGVLAVEFAVLQSLSPVTVLPVLVGVLSLSTGVAALLLCRGRPMKEGRGLASFLMNQRRGWFAPFIVVLMLGLSLIALGLAGLFLLLVTLLATVALSVWYNHRLGGINGDCCGAAIMIVQVVLLLTVGAIDHLGVLPLEGVFASW